jgi:hypothetical protein
MRKEDFSWLISVMLEGMNRERLEKLRHGLDKSIKEKEQKCQTH